MKKNLFVVFILLVMPPMVRADFVLHQAENAVNSFNALNNGLGYHYSVSPDKGGYRMTTMQGTDQAGFGAYAPQAAGESFAKTFCVEPNIGTMAKHFGQLNYENNSTTTTSGDSLSLGSAYLYASFANGTLDGYNYASRTENEDLAYAIQYLMGAVDTYNPWGVNGFLDLLLGINDNKSYWEQTYDPGRFYDEIGDYSVFVMNNQDAYGVNAQDFLFLVGYDGNEPGGTVPEPATLLILGTGLTVLPFLRRRKKTHGSSTEEESEVPVLSQQV